jgi:hypothetical protein
MSENYLTLKQQSMDRHFAVSMWYLLSTCYKDGAQFYVLEDEVHYFLDC